MDQWHRRGLVNSSCDHHAQQGQHAVHRYAPYQGPKPNRPQGNPGLLYSHTLLCCRSKMFIHVMDMNSHLAPGCSMGLIYLDSWMANPRFPRTDSREIRGGSGCMGRSIILDQNKIVLEQGCSGRWLLFKVRPFVAASVHLPVHSAIQYNQLTFATSWNRAHMMTDGPTLPSVPCTQISMCLSRYCLHTRACRFVWCNVNLHSSVKIQRRYWQMSQRRWRLAHWWQRQRCTKARQKHRAGLREWYPAAGRRRTMVCTGSWRPVWRISWALNLELDRNLVTRIVRSKQRSSRGVEIFCEWHLVWHP